MKKKGTLKVMKTADLHCDTISEIWKTKNLAFPQDLHKNSLHIDIQKMKKSDYLLQNFAMFTDLQKVDDPFAYVMELIGVFNDEMAKNKNDIGAIRTFDEILENERHGKISALLTIEEGGCCMGEIKNLETLHGLGVRMMTLTWNYPNELAAPNAHPDGLTKKGFLFIERMEELGMIIDVSHLSDAGFRDVAKNTKKPFAASHSNARALCGHARNLTDEMIKTIADRGGIIGLNFCASFLCTRAHNEISCYRNMRPARRAGEMGVPLLDIEKDNSRSTVAKMAEHVRHIINVGGSDCLGLGSDFDGIAGELEMQDCSQLYKLADELERRHFTYTQIEKIFCGNVMRFYREML